MKMVMAIVRPEKYEDVKEALKAEGIVGMTFNPVTGRGKQAGVKFTNRFGEFTVDEIEKMMIDIVVEDSQVDLVIGTVCKVAWTGRNGDGMIFVSPVEQAVRIRERGPPEGSQEEGAEHSE
jgi:nitrogen regulatory protein P-II 1